MSRTYKDLLIGLSIAVLSSVALISSASENKQLGNDLKQLSYSIDVLKEQSNRNYHHVEKMVSNGEVSNPVREFYWLTTVLAGANINYEMASISLNKVKRFDEEAYHWMVVSLNTTCPKYKGCDFQESILALQKKYPNNAFLAFVNKIELNADTPLTYENGASRIYPYLNVEENQKEITLFERVYENNNSVLSANGFFALSSNFRYIPIVPKNTTTSACHPKDSNFNSAYCLKIVESILVNDDNFLSNQVARIYLGRYCDNGWCNTHQKDLLLSTQNDYFARMSPNNYIKEFNRMNWVFNRAVQTGVFCDSIKDDSDCYKSMPSKDDRPFYEVMLNILRSFFNS